MTERRGYILCLDGENLETLEGFIRRFNLSNLGRMLESGLGGALDPGLIPVTPPAWASFLTGTWFPRHGVTGFFRHDGRTHADRLVSSLDVVGETILTVADRQAARVICLNLPMTSPSPELRHGAVVSGFLTRDPSGFAAWPPGVRSRISAKIPGYQTILPTARREPGDRRSARLALLAEMVRRMHWRPMVLAELLAEGPPRLAIVHCQETDILHHAAWDIVSNPDSATHEEMEVIREVYEIADTLAGLLQDEIGEGGMGLLLSDHGGMETRWILQPNDLLASWGLATFLAGADGTLSRSDEFGMSLPVRTRRWFRRALGLNPPVEKGFRGELLNRELLLDWERTRLYVGVGDLACHFFRGDGPRMSDPETESVRQRLVQFRLPDGTPAFEAVLHRGEVFLQERASDDSLPLLVGVPAPGVFVSRRTGGGGTRAVDDPSQGTHRRLGMYCWTGPGVPRGRPESPMPIVDVLPTMLQALGLVTPDGLDGRPLTSVIGDAGRDAAAARRPLENPVLSTPERQGADEEEEIERRLRDLGYLV